MRKVLEDKFKTSVDAAKEGSKIAKDKIKQVKTEIENKKNAPASEHDPDENTPEEIEQELKFMGDFIKENNKQKDNVSAQAETTEKKEEEKKSEEKPAEDAPIDLEHRY